MHVLAVLTEINLHLLKYINVLSQVVHNVYTNLTTVSTSPVLSLSRKKPAKTINTQMRVGQCQPIWHCKMSNVKHRDAGLHRHRRRR